MTDRQYEIYAEATRIRDLLDQEAAMDLATDFDFEIAIGNMVLFHRPPWRDRLRRLFRVKLTGRGGRMRCACGYITAPGEWFEYHQGREAVSALRKIGCELRPPRFT